MISFQFILEVFTYVAESKSRFPVAYLYIHFLDRGHPLLLYMLLHTYLYSHSLISQGNIFQTTSANDTSRLAFGSQNLTLSNPPPSLLLVHNSRMIRSQWNWLQNTRRIGKSPYVYLATTCKKPLAWLGGSSTVSLINTVHQFHERTVAVISQKNKNK